MGIAIWIIAVCCIVDTFMKFDHWVLPIWQAYKRRRWLKHGK